VPKGKTNANLPVLFFIHGGAWKSGDRSNYVPLGNRYAKEGVITVVPSYRLAPKHPHPAQIEDAAAAFAWTVRHIAEYGGDTNRIYAAGHSAGGHLVALLSLDTDYLAKYQLSPKALRGVLAWSGVYNLAIGESQESVFGKDMQGRRAASPLFYVKAGAPPFVVTYCQWDYFSLPGQALEFYHALRQAGVEAELVYVPHESHISEMLSVTRAKDLTVTSALKFMQQAPTN
jgi:acetyl esterase/lipase